MASYSQASIDRLATCDRLLQRPFIEIIEWFDHKILYGHRTPEEQFTLFKRGRKLVNGVWVVENQLEVVTWKDGIEHPSKHNFFPSLAIDVIPYPLDWRDETRACYFAGIVMATARGMGVDLRWGGDWDRDTQLKDERFVDLWHFELMR